MNGYVDEKISLEDLQLLRSIMDVDKKKLQIEIIDTLGGIYKLVNDSLEYSDVINRNYKYFVGSFKNVLKSAVFSIGSFIFSMNLLDKDPDLLYSFLTCSCATVFGSSLFQVDNRKENYVSSDVLVNASDKYKAIFDEIQRLTEVYYDTARVYFDGKKDYVMKDEMKKIFSNNSAYIEKMKRSGKFYSDFSFDVLCDVAGDYFDDNIMKEFLSFYEKDMEKQKQRKL